MKRLVSVLHLLLFGLILVHSAMPHTHGDEALSQYPTFNAAGETHTFLFLEIDLGEDHLEDFTQLDNDIIAAILPESRSLSPAPVSSSVAAKQAPKNTGQLLLTSSDRAPPLG